MIDVETYAAINAQLAREGADREAILAEHGLDEESWETLEAHWQDELSRAMDADIEEQGVPQVVSDMSAAFSSAQQASAGEGVISLEQFAHATRQIANSQDIGVSLKRLGISLPQFLKANQHWCVKMVSDRDLAERFRRIVSGDE